MNSNNIPTAQLSYKAISTFLRLSGKIFFLLLFPAFLSAQSLHRPKLVVGIVVDQMRYDFLYRYYNKYSDKGFKRLLNEGLSCENTHYNYVPTYTGPGHASIYTGSTPEYHGIVGNEWYDRATGRVIYCVSDTGVKAIGGSDKAGQMSPRNLISTNIADELKLATNGQSKVIAISLKDRASILPGGHAATAAYWFDDASGNIITSSWYMQILPDWLKTFNEKHLADNYLKQQWNTLLPISDYVESTPDNVPWEAPYIKGSSPVFPYDLNEIKLTLSKKSKTPYDLLRSTPYGNTYTKDLAIATISGENLGSNITTDMLCISFSSTDYIGHQFGPNAVETEDTYLRLDKDLGELIDFLDNKIGRNNYLLFLTADHGAAHTPDYLKTIKIPAGVFNEKLCVNAAKDFLNKTYGNARWIDTCINQQFYLNHQLIQNKGLQLNEMQDRLCMFLRNYPGIFKVFTAYRLLQNDLNGLIETSMQKGFNMKRSGDVLYALEAGWFEGHEKGTTHGAAYPYDTHVPLLWLGYHIPHEEIIRNIDITDIAATLAYLLKIQEPNACIGKPIPILPIINK